MGRVLLPSPLGPSTVKRPSCVAGSTWARLPRHRVPGMNGCLNNFTKDAELEFCSRNDGYFYALNPRSDACPQRR